MPDDPDAHDSLVDGVLQEAARRPEWAPQTTIYLGGGTPGLLAPETLEQLLVGLRATAPFASGAEVTLEVNPTNVSTAALADWESLGITRLSVGVQTFRDDVLRGLARLHDGPGARHALDAVRDAWSATWSADLLMGWHGQSQADAAKDVAELLQWRPPHVSVYGLTIEPGTPLARRQDQGQTE